MNDPKFIAGAAAVVVAITAAVVTISGVHYSRVSKVEACERAGGIAALAAREGYVCVRAGSVVTP